MAKDGPRPIAHPPVIAAAGLALGFALDALWPSPILPSGLQYGLGFALLLVGVALAGLAVWQFHRAGTAVPTWQAASRLVTHGLYARSRNPIYIALGLIHAGLAVAADAPLVLASLPAVLLVLHFGVILREERYLDARFGEPYRRYRASVRRWL